MNGNLPLNISEASSYGLKNATPAIISILATKGATAGLSAKTKVPKWATGFAGLLLGYYMITHRASDTTKSVGAGVAMGGTWEVADSILKATSGKNLEGLIMSWFSRGTGGS